MNFIEILKHYADIKYSKQVYCFQTVFFVVLACRIMKGSSRTLWAYRDTNRFFWSFLGLSYYIYLNPPEPWKCDFYFYKKIALKDFPLRTDKKDAECFIIEFSCNDRFFCAF